MTWSRPPKQFETAWPGRPEIAVFLAALAALGFGFGDFLGGTATRSLSVWRALLWAHGIGLALVAGWAVTASTGPARADLLAGSVAGLFGMVGLALLYNGLARGRAAVVAPTAAVVGAVIPVVAGVLGGERPGWTTWLGVAIAFPAIVIASSVDGVARRTAGLKYGLGAGVFFGGYFVALAASSPGSELWPLIASRGTSVLVLTLAALLVSRRWFQVPTGGAGWAVLGVGVIDLVGNVTYLLATKVGALVVVAVVASLYPAVTVVISRFVYEEHLSSRQIAGLVLALAAVALLAGA